ncbi:hypothetical protein Ancab_032030 [Ancistrocladus abbreviatus]
MMMVKSMSRTVKIWRSRLGAAWRIVLAYAIVGCATLYGPKEVQDHVTYPAFSYLTATLIVSEATLGDTLRGAWQALIGTCLIMGPAVLSLWLVGPAQFSANLAAFAVGLLALGVALPESTPLMSKRIAFGQLVIVYVGTVIQGSNTQIVMHPLHVAASTGLGVLASILAMVLPFPYLATFEVREKCKLYLENASERLNLYMKAIVAEESSAVLELAAEAKTLTESAANHLQTVQRYQDGMLWEMPHLRLLRPDYKHPAERLQEVETSLRGMEMALASPCQSPKDSVDKQLKDELQTMSKQLTEHIEEISSYISFTAPKAQDQKVPKDDSFEKQLLPLNICATQQHLLLSFYFFCIKGIGQEDSGASKNDQKPVLKDANKDEYSFGKSFRSWLPSYQSIIFAIKCSISLGLAVFLGLTYNKDRGYWAGLAIAASFVMSRQATFWGANARAQGTALGSIYGIIGYFVFQKFSGLRLAFLLPWIIFTTFLRHSKMYGEAGSVSAVVAALLILGRKGYGTPTEFAVARTTETCIGLFCFTLVEILLQPERAATLSKDQLSQCLTTIKDFMANIMAPSTSQSKSDNSDPTPSLEAQERRLKGEICELKEFIEEAKVEPNFWFAPFQGDCYTQLEQSISKMANLLSYMSSAVESLHSELRKSGDGWEDNQEQIGIDIELFKEKLCSSLKHLEKTISSGPNGADEKEQQGEISSDLEMGKPQNDNRYRIPCLDEEEIENIQSTFLQHTRDLTESNRAAENAEVRNRVLLSLGCVGFCMRSIVTETREVERQIRELIRKEKS